MKTEHESVKAMWGDFLRNKEAPSEQGYTSWHFELTEESANKLADLVKIGQKKATAAALWSFEQNNEPLPQVGDYSVITDWYGIAQCIIQTTKVEILPFRDVTEEHARIEGEGDLSLDYWRKVHEIYYKKICEQLGKEFTEELPVVFEQFEVVYVPKEQL